MPNRIQAGAGSLLSGADGRGAAGLNDPAVEDQGEITSIQPLANGQQPIQPVLNHVQAGGPKPTISAVTGMLTNQGPDRPKAPIAAAHTAVLVMPVCCSHFSQPTPGTRCSLSGSDGAST